MEYYGYVVLLGIVLAIFDLAYHRLNISLAKDLQDATSQKWHHIITVSLPLCSLFHLAWESACVRWRWELVLALVKENHTVQFLVGFICDSFYSLNDFIRNRTSWWDLLYQSLSLGALLGLASCRVLN